MAWAHTPRQSRPWTSHTFDSFPPRCAFHSKANQCVEKREALSITSPAGSMNAPVPPSELNKNTLVLSRKKSWKNRYHYRNQTITFFFWPCFRIRMHRMLSCHLKPAKVNAHILPLSLSLSFHPIFHVHAWPASFLVQSQPPALRRLRSTLPPPLQLAPRPLGKDSYAKGQNNDSKITMAINYWRNDGNEQRSKEKHNSPESLGEPRHALHMQGLE